MKKKTGFTMLELVFVIVVVGILGAVLVPKYDRDNAGEAAYQLARHIRLAQHHALVYDAYGTTKAYQITFAGTTYTVSDGTTAVIDPLTKTPLSGYDMAKNFGVTSIAGVSGVLSFDHLGRPNLASDINITLQANGIEAKVSVYQETGLVKVAKIGNTVL